MANELVVEQDEDSFSTQLVLNLKPNRPKSIQEHVNWDRMKKVQSGKPMSILDHIHLHEEMSSIMLISPMRKYAY